MEGSYNVLQIEKYHTKPTPSTRNFRELKQGEVLIKVMSSTIHPADLFFLAGSYGRYQPDVFPIVPGFEGSGEIVKVGEGVEPGLVGRRASFICNPNKTGEYEGAWAQYVYVSRYLVIPFESSTIPFEKISFSFVNPITVCGFIDTLQKTNVSTVIQNGAAGALGKMFIRLCVQHKIKTINLVRKEEQINELKNLGADYVINTSNNGWESEFEKLALETKAYAAFECVGDDTTAKLLSLMPDGSTVYNYGNLEAKPIRGVSSGDLIFRDKTLTGWWLSTWLSKLKPEEIMKWFEHIRQDLEGPNPIFETEYRKDHYTLSNFDEAFAAYTKNMSAGKAIIRPNN